MKRSKFDPDQKYQEWQTQIQRIWNTLVHLAHIDDVFWQVMAIARSDPALMTPEGNIFGEWLRWTYTSSLVIGLRSLVDGTHNTPSLKRLLQDLEAHAPRVLTRDRYVGLYSEELRYVAHRHFDQIVAPGATHVSKGFVRNDRVLLETRLKSISDFANQFVTHLALNPTAPSPSYPELRLALRAVGDTFKRYYLLLLANAMEDIVPVIQDNWLAVFRSAWLPLDTAVPTYTKLGEVDRCEGIRIEESSHT